MTEPTPITPNGIPMTTIGLEGVIEERGWGTGPLGPNGQPERRGIPTLEQTPLIQ